MYLAATKKHKKASEKFDAKSLFGGGDTRRRQKQGLLESYKSIYIEVLL